MPVVCGEFVSSVEEITQVLGRYGDRVRGTYRAVYRFDATTRDPYSDVRLERPDSLRENPPEIVYPWEQIFMTAAACAGSDYPMLSAHYDIPLGSVELVIEGVFDPRAEFTGLHGFHAPADARHCYQSLHIRSTLVSSAPRERLEMLHDRAVSHNMVLDALRGIPLTTELITHLESPHMAVAGAVR